MDPLASVNDGWGAAPVSASPTASASAPSSASPAPAPAPQSPSADTTIRQPQVIGDPGTALMHPPPPPPNEKPAPFLRVRIGALERNRKDLLIRYDASVSPAQSGCGCGAAQQQQQ